VVPKVATEDGDEQSTKKETGALKTCATLGLLDSTSLVLR